MTKLPNSEQSYKGKVKTHKYINRQNQSTYISNEQILSIYFDR
jgi:hypothetical protein